MHCECRERFPRHRLQKKTLVSDPGMHHTTCITHVPCCISGSLTRCDGENVPGIPGACATHNFTYLARGPCWGWPSRIFMGHLASSGSALIFVMFNYSSACMRLACGLRNFTCRRLLLLVLILEYSRSISWLLMPWHHASPGHLQPWYWLCRMNTFKYFNIRRTKSQT